MIEFEANLINDYTIEILSNTSWEAFSIGDFRLSKYYGNGNDTIRIIVPDDIYMADGVVRFKYGDEKCTYPTIDIVYTNKCYVETTPNYVTCNGEKTVFLFYNYNKEILEFKLSPNMSNYNVINNGYTIFQEDNNVFKVISDVNNQEDEILIEIGGPDDNCDTLHVKILPKNVDE